MQILSSACVYLLFSTARSGAVHLEIRAKVVWSMPAGIRAQSKSQSTSLDFTWLCDNAINFTWSRH